MFEKHEKLTKEQQTGSQVRLGRLGTSAWLCEALALPFSLHRRSRVDWHSAVAFEPRPLSVRLGRVRPPVPPANTCLEPGMYYFC